MAKTHELSFLTRNTNIKAPEDVPTTAKGKGGSVDPFNGKSSLYNTVLKRRKSRQSNFAPGSVDFNYAGDSAQFNHLIQKRMDHGQATQSQLNFEMNMRGYKNITDFQAVKPWQFPSVKTFSPKA